MKKLLSLLLAILMILTLGACGKDEDSKGEKIKDDNVSDTNSEEPKTEEDIAKEHLWYYSVDFDKLETKEVSDFKVYGYLAPPFDINTIKNDITKVHYTITTEQGYPKIVDYLSLDEVLDMPSDRNEKSFGFNVGGDDNNGRDYGYVIVTPKDTSMSSKEAIANGYCYLETSNDFDKFLDIDVSNTDYKVKDNDATVIENMKPLMDKVIERFGKPTEVEVLNIFSDGISYKLRYKMDKYVMVISISESYDIETDKYEARSTMSVYTPESYNICVETKKYYE